MRKKEYQERFETYEKEMLLKEQTDNYVCGKLTLDRYIYGMQDIICHRQEIQTDHSICIIARCTKCGSFGNIAYKNFKVILGLPEINRKHSVCRSCLLSCLEVW